MLKKLFIITLLSVVALSAYLYWDYSAKRTVITPYTYSFLNSFDKNYEAHHALDLKQAESAKILILGDRMGKTLDTYTKNIQEQFGGAFKTPPSIFNWSADNEGLFRTIHKLKMLKKLPPIIIYFGASSELTEKKFRVEDKKNILKNFETYDNEKLISLIITFPWLSKVLYKNVKYFDLAEYTEYKSMLASPQKLEEKELSFKFFQYEMKEMIDYIKDKKSNLVVITTPINLEVEPKEVCAHSSNDQTVGVQQEIEAELKEGAYKTAFPKAQKLSEVTFSNARSFYLLGRAALGTGDIKTARESLLKASVFDCSSWRGNAVYNAIIKSLAQKNLVHVVDFDQFMTSNLSKEGLYFDEIIPQNVFYQSMIKELGDILKKILSIE
ncbi:MAG: hypothetical protein H7177_10365 [Rhizobacter sp.]|nr:hypothetical protein [Bacteriovorax sp.]